MVDTGYVPDRGDLVWLDFNPQAGREQMGRRPAIVISPKNYNQRSHLALFCPVTSRIKGYPFEVPLQATEKITGVVISDQVKSLDWTQRNVEFVEKADSKVFGEVIEKLSLLII